MLIKVSGNVAINVIASRLMRMLPSTNQEDSFSYAWSYRLRVRVAARRKFTGIFKNDAGILMTCLIRYLPLCLRIGHDLFVPRSYVLCVRIFRFQYCFYSNNNSTDDCNPILDPWYNADYVLNAQLKYL
jgi:hypothetical protein